MRDAHEQAIMEMGKTPLGNIPFGKNKKLSSESSTSELKSNKEFFILSLDGGGLR